MSRNSSRIRKFTRLRISGGGKPPLKYKRKGNESYEKEGFCHRHLFADWLENNLGYVVEEYKVD